MSEQKLREALQELVALKDLKDRHTDDNGYWTDIAACTDYRERQPRAWQKAREALSQPQTSDEGTPSEHVWVCISPGEYDSLYRCHRCGANHMTQADKVESELPTRGCLEQPHADKVVETVTTNVVESETPPKQYSMSEAEEHWLKRRKQGFEVMWVSASQVEKLERENAELASELKETTKMRDVYYETCEKLEQKNAELRERLRNAPTALRDAYNEIDRRRPKPTGGDR